MQLCLSIELQVIEFNSYLLVFRLKNGLFLLLQILVTFRYKLKYIYLFLLVHQFSFTTIIYTKCNKTLLGQSEIKDSIFTLHHRALKRGENSFSSAKVAPK